MSRALIAAALIVGAAIILARVIAPYQFVGAATMVWRGNTITGKVVPCNFDPGSQLPNYQVRLTTECDSTK